MKKLMAVLVGIMMFSSIGMVFADETTDGVKREALSKEEARAQVVQLFETYNPDALDAFNSVNSEHKLFHEEARAERAAYKAELPEGSRENLKEIKAILDMKRSDDEMNKAELRAVRLALRAAVKEETTDASIVASHLDELVSLLEDHLAIDVEYYNQVHALRK